MSEEHTPKQKKKESKMVARLINFQPTLYDEAMVKAKKTGVPLSFIIRSLLKLWLRGEIQIVLTNNENDGN